MKPNLKKFLLALVLVMLTTFGMSYTASAQSQIVIEKQFDWIEQGSVGIIKVTGPNLAGGVAVVFDHQYPFFSTSQGFASLISVDFRQKINDYPIKVTLYEADGSKIDWEDTIKVTSGGFIAESDFALPSNKVYLLNPDIQTNEDARILSVFSVVTPERYWDGPFNYPLNGRIGSPFGSVRTFNGGEARRHTGVDLSAAAGTPVYASANGRIVFARPMDIHGNHVIIDHGWGVFSSYSHLSALYVVPGQMVMQGDVIGLSGTTGRSTGPHLHWEIGVNGNWVDPVKFARVKLPN